MMYITITRQHMGQTFSQSSGDLVDYLEKENEGKSPELREPFFALHILPRAFVCIRHYGILSSCKKNVVLPLLREQVVM